MAREQRFSASSLKTGLRRQPKPKQPDSRRDSEGHRAEADFPARDAEAGDRHDPAMNTPLQRSG